MTPLSHALNDALDCIGQRDKHTTQRALARVEQALGSEFDTSVRVMVRTASCAVDIGRWESARESTVRVFTFTGLEVPEAASAQSRVA